jgi:hypothetical protein
VIESGQQKCGRFTRAGLRLAGDILAPEGDRQRRCLDRGAVAEPGFFDAARDGLGELELPERQ